MVFQKNGIQLIEIFNMRQTFNINCVKLGVVKGKENIKSMKIHAHVGNEVKEFYNGEFKEEVLINNANTRHLMIELDLQAEEEKDVLGMQSIQLYF